MALIKCSECEKEISDKATSCPNCGCPLNNSQSRSTTFQDGNNKISTQTYSYCKYIPIKIIAVIVCIVIAICIVIIYFNNKKPSDVSDEMYNLGIEALEVIDDYLDNEIDSQATYKKLSSIDSNATQYYNTKSNGEFFNNKAIFYTILALTSGLNEDTVDNLRLLENRNALAKAIDKDERTE